MHKRLLAITKAITNLPVDPDRVEAKVRSKRRSLTERLTTAKANSDHTLIERPNGRMVCTACRAFVAPGRLLRWLEAYPKCDRAWANIPARSSTAVPLPDGAWIGKRQAHASHKLLT